MTDIKIDQLIRSHRRSISLMINQEAQLIVRAPFSTPQSYIEKAIQQRHAWIIAKQEHFRRKPKAAPKQFLAGEQFLFLGQNYSLEVADDLPKAIMFNETLKISRMVLNNAREHMFIWYKEQALIYIAQRVDEIAKANDLIYQSVKVNAAQTRWGSCGYQGSLNFSWRLIMAPPRVIDYVIVHELMHIKQRNHSRKFWQEVKSRIPDYKQDEQWLSHNSHLLGL